MQNPPSGAVSFLLADVQNSAMLSERDPAAMRAAHSRYQDVLHGAIEANGGYAIQTIGDALHAAFSTASQAVQAAIDAQLLLFVEQWPPSIDDLQVRMAIDAGAIERDTGGYSGPTLNRATSLLSAGHGGQVLLSSATQELVRGALSRFHPADPPGVQLLDLGEHRLKDLSHVEHVFELVVPGLPTHFPALHTLNSLPNNLPRQATPLIGREKQTADVIALLHRSDISLVTLTGPPGTGKTRLSLHVGAQILEEYKDGVWFVELATLSPEDHRLVPSVIAETLCVREAPGQELADTLKDYLKDRQMLLVLDNFEQVIPASPQISALLKAAPQLKALATSRTALRLYGEREYRVPPLTVPDRKVLQELKWDRHLDLSPDEQVGQQAAQQRGQVQEYTRYESVRLFVDRAQAVTADFVVSADNALAIAKICARLDGLPLAIELAAARIRLFTPHELLARLSSRFKILTGGARDLPARQQTMRGAIEWSYDLLDQAEQQLFKRLAVFNGGRTLEAVERVCNYDGRLQADVLEGVQSLLNKSMLVEREGSDRGSRYWMLETIHEYAGEKLKESGEEEALKREHALYFMSLAEEAEPQLKGKEQEQWLNKLEDEHDNLRAAIQWAIARARAGAPTGQTIMHAEDTPHAGETVAIYVDEAEEVGLRIASALWQFWNVRGHLNLGRQLLASVLGTSGTSEIRQVKVTKERPEAASSEVAELGTGAKAAESKATRAKALSGAGNLADKQGAYTAARALHEESLAIRRELGDKSGIAASLNNLGLLARKQGDHTAARALHEESLAIRRELGDKSGMASALNNLGSVAYVQGDYEVARTLFEESLTLRKELGDESSIAASLNNLAAVVFSLGDYPAARSLHEESLAIERELGDEQGIAISLNNLGDVTCMLGDYAAARSLYEQSLELMKELEDKAGIASLLHNLGNVAYNQGDYPGALSEYEQSLAMKRGLGDKDGIASSLLGMGRVAVRLRKAERGAKLLGAAEALLQTTGAVLEPVDRQLMAEGVALARNRLGEEAFERLRAEGLGTSMEEAVEYALRPAVYGTVHVQFDEDRLERQRHIEEELHIKIDQDRKARQVEAITGSEYFIELQARASALVLERKEREAGSHRQQ